MWKGFKRLCAFAVLLAMAISLLPVCQRVQAVELDQEAYAEADALFDQIDAMENRSAIRGVMQKQLTEAAMEIVLASDSYMENSLNRTGDSFTWWTDDGIRCIYSPRMRQIEKNVTAADVAQDVIVNEPQAIKGGSTSEDQVYLIGPYYGYDVDFTDQYKKEARRIATAIGDTDGYTLYSGTAATVDKVAEAVSNGAVVIFDSHGITDYEYGDDYVTGANNSYLCLTSTTGLTREDYVDGALYYSDGICINGATIANHMTKDSPGGLLWMAICLGMATDTLCTPLRQRGVEVVYGYSQTITFGADYLFEETFWEEMLEGNTVADSIATMKNTWGNWDGSTQIANYYSRYESYSTISSARKDYMAFPIVVSDEDAHPGQRSNSSYGACSLQTVRSTYSLEIVAVPEINPVARNHRRIVDYIDANGIDFGGKKTWIESNSTDTAEVYYFLQNTPDGLLFTMQSAYEKGLERVVTKTQLLVPETEDNLDVEYAASWSYGAMEDYLYAIGNIERAEFSYSSAYEINGGKYLSSETASSMYTLAIQALCMHWDSSIYLKFGFGLRGLGFVSYNGYGDPVCAHKYDNDCDETCNTCGEKRLISHTYGAYSSVDAFYHDRTCAVCGWIEKSEHYWDGGTVIPTPAGHAVLYICIDCGAIKTEKLWVAGDLDGLAGVNEDDAIYLLQHVLMPDLFPVEQPVDYDKNGTVDEDDAIYLLQYVLMPDFFPL